jgi:hypothetical protein
MQPRKRVERKDIIGPKRDKVPGRGRSIEFDDLGSAGVQLPSYELRGET